MVEMAVYDGDGSSSDGGVVIVGLADANATLLQLTVQDLVTATDQVEATVLLTRESAVDLMAQLGVFVASA